MIVVKIRYNTAALPENPLKWRVLIDGEEKLASSIKITCESFTSMDDLPQLDGSWITKAHITAYADVLHWANHDLTIY